MYYFCIQNQTIMDTRQKVIVESNEIILSKLIDLVEQISSVEFVETICKNVGVDLNDVEGVENVKSLIGTRVHPLMVKMWEYDEFSLDFREMEWL